MKKLILLFISITLCLSLAGCFEADGTQNKNSGDTSSTNSTSSVSSEKVSSTDKDSSGNTSKQLDEAGIRALVKENINCIKNIFVFGSLPTVGSPLRENIYQVDKSQFKDYAAFETYVKSVYTSDVANVYLNDYPYEGQAKYINADGKLCIDMDKDSPKGYFVDWSDYKVSITKSSEAECEFTLTAYIEEPSDTPQKEEYKVSSSAKLENGKWLLTKMIY